SFTRRRPPCSTLCPYTTLFRSRPNHLAQEIIDNSVDEALAGYAKKIDVFLHKDNSVTVADDGRGMPVDIHPEQGKSGVEVILSRSEEHTSELQSRENLVCRLLL